MKNVFRSALFFCVIFLGTVVGVASAGTRMPQDFCDMSGLWVGKNVRGSSVNLKKTMEQASRLVSPVRFYQGHWDGSLVDVRHDYVQRNIEEANMEFRNDIIRVYEKKASSAPNVRSADISVRTLWIGADCTHFRVVEEISNVKPDRRWKYNDQRAPVYRRAKSGADISRPKPPIPTPNPVKKFQQPGWKPVR
ncbi:MAG: hypothetical protein ACE5IR_18520 [bacterium]